MRSPFRSRSTAPATPPRRRPLAERSYDAKHCALGHDLANQLLICGACGSSSRWALKKGLGYLPEGFEAKR